MAYFVYILQSDLDRSYYKGFTENYSERLKQHNSGFSIYTSRKTPWKLLHVEEHALKANALKREKNLKKATKERIEALIKSTKNLLKV